MNVFRIYIVLFLICGSAFAQISKTEKEALLDLHRFTNGHLWTVPWNIADDVKSWAGVKIADDKVVGIDLAANNLEGELPSSIGDLIHLKHLDLSKNALIGELPDSLGDLQHLETVALNGNNLSGEIPKGLTKIEKLEMAKSFFAQLASRGK